MSIIALGFALFIGLKIYSADIAKYKDINLEQLNTKLYIEAADNVSNGKFQVNWQYIAAIDGVRYKNDFSKVTDENVNALANMFLDKNSTSTKLKNSEYKLVDLEAVLDKFAFDKSQREKVYHYIDNLKFTGTKKNNLNDSSKQEFIKEIYPQAADIYDKIWSTSFCKYFSSNIGKWMG